MHRHRLIASRLQEEGDLDLRSAFLGLSMGVPLPGCSGCLFYLDPDEPSTPLYKLGLGI